MREGIQPPAFADKFHCLDFEAVPMPVISLYPVPSPISADGFRLEACGLEQPLRTISETQLRALKPVKLKAPLICQIFNWVEEVEWEGWRFSDFLDVFQIGTHPEGYFSVYSRDGVYFETLSADEARDPRVLLAFKLNGAPLPELHGGPVRLVVPFLQGYKSVKWVSSVRGFRKDPVGIKRLLGQSPAGRLNAQWIARCNIALPAGRTGDPASDVTDPSAAAIPSAVPGPVPAVTGSETEKSGSVHESVDEKEVKLKEIMAFLRPQRHAATRQALEEAGVIAYTTFRVLGRGRQGGLRFPDAAEDGAAIRLLPKQCFSILLEESQVPAALQAIAKANRTGQGEHGDGKVFVLDVSDALRISTDERGPSAL